METQKTLNSQRNGAGGTRLSDLRLILQSYSKQESMVLVQTQKYRSME